MFFSCIPRNEPLISIENSSLISYDSIIVFTSYNMPTKFYNVSSNDKVGGKIMFDNNKKGDGCYKIRIYKKDSLTFGNCFGYYTNGASLNYKFDIKIEPDTLIIKSK